MLDLAGQRFGRLVAQEFVSREAKWPSQRYAWKCVCDCGGSAIVAASKLRRGATKSCGCQRVLNKLTHGSIGTQAYRSWSHMIQRCENPKNARYEDYGGRGISVCERWHSFPLFLADMGQPATKGLSLDRIDNAGNYEPGNCRWATNSQQALNRRPKGSGSKALRAASPIQSEGASK